MTCHSSVIQNHIMKETGPPRLLTRARRRTHVGARIRGGCVVFGQRRPRPRLQLPYLEPSVFLPFRRRRTLLLLLPSMPALRSLYPLLFYSPLTSASATSRNESLHSHAHHPVEPHVPTHDPHFGQPRQTGRLLDRLADPPFHTSVLHFCHFWPRLPSASRPSFFVRSPRVVRFPSSPVVCPLSCRPAFPPHAGYFSRPHVPRQS